MERLTPERVVCSNCGGACMFKHDGNEITVIHSCWSQQQREKFDALRAERDLLTGLLNQLLVKRRDGLGEWWLVAEPSEELLDRCGAALSNPAIAERLAAEEELRAAIIELAQPESSFKPRKLIEAAERMWPSGKEGAKS